MFLEISKNSEKNTCNRVSFLISCRLRPVTLLKKRLWHRPFPVNFAKYLRTPFFHRTPQGDCFWIYGVVFYRQKIPQKAPWYFFDRVLNNVMLSDFFVNNSVTLSPRSEAVAQRCSIRKVFSEISQNSQGNTFARVSFLIKLQPSGLQLY